MATIGKLSSIRNESEVEWRILDFSTLSAKDDKRYHSPLFYFANASWCLQIYPNGMKEKQSIGYIGVYLLRKCSGSPISLNYSLILKTMDVETDREWHTSFAFFISDYGCGVKRILKRSKFLESRSKLRLPDILTVICKMKHPQCTENASKTETVECSHCKKPFEAETISIHEGKCLDKPIKCPECQKFRAEACEKVSQDWKAVMLNGDLSDIVIKVKGEEFRLHRTVLAARNSYFNSMFKSDMKEKNTGMVSIEDCEPGIFRSFIHFVYTGKVDKLLPDNVCELYEVADKYQEDQLKKQCFGFMKKALSEDTFCDFIVLALMYDEKELFEKAVEFFKSKPNEIVRSIKWQSFMGEYPTQANELIKLVDRHVK